MKLMAFQLNPYEIELIDLSTLNSSTTEKIQEILGFHWMNANELLVITKAGIFLCRSNRIGRWHIKNTLLRLSISHYWYEGNTGVVLVALSAPNVGAMKIYFTKPFKNYKQKTKKDLFFICHDEKDDTWICNSLAPKNFNTRTALFNQSPHRIALELIGDELYIIHIDCSNELCEYVKIENSQLRRDFFKLPAGDFDLKIINSMIVAQDASTSISILYDIRSHEFPMTQSRSLDSAGLSNSLYVYSVANFGQKVQSNFIAIDSNLVLDLENGVCYQLELLPTEIAKCHPDPQESLQLLLRTECKADAIDSLKNLLATLELNKSIELLTNLTLYSKSNEECLRRRCSGRNSGLFPEEITNLVLRPLFAQKTMKSNVFYAILLAYKLMLAEQNMPVPLSLDILFVQQLLDERNYISLCKFIEAKVIEDSCELAGLLYEIYTSTQEQVIRYTLIDMLYRLKLLDNLNNVLMQGKFDFEVYYFSDRHCLEVNDLAKVSMYFETTRNDIEEE